MFPISRHINMYLIKWLMRKYKHLSGHKRRASKLLGKLAMSMPNAFVHWEGGYVI
jgi:RNA-directed DNA polymerase